MASSSVRCWRLAVGLVVAASMAVATNGCAGDELSVGSESTGTTPEDCRADPGRCQRPARVAAERPASISCPDQPEAQLEVEQVLPLGVGLCPVPNDVNCVPGDRFVETYCSACTLALRAFALAPDGTVWVALAASRISGVNEFPETLYLGRIVDGVAHYEEIARSSTLSGSTVSYSVSIAVDENSEAYVLVTAVTHADAESQPRTKTSLQRYGADGRSIGGALDLPDIAQGHVAIDSQGRLVVAGAKELYGLHSVGVTAFDRDGSALWSQQELWSVGAGVMNLDVDAAGQSFVRFERGVFGDPDRYGVARIDAQGALRWERTFAASELRESSGAALVVDAAGNLTVAGQTQMPDFTMRQRISSYDAEAAPRWALEVAGMAAHLTVHKQSGHIYFADNSDPLSRSGNVYRIASDGTCGRYGYTNVDSFVSIEVARDGQLYFISDEWVGRFKSLRDD